MLFVLQVDDKGDVIEDAYIKAVSDTYKEEPLKALVKSKAPDCIKQANKAGNGRLKITTVLALGIPSEFTHSVIS
jgi:hypothetical protein